MRVDVYPWPGADVVCDTTRLPFPDRYFDAVIMLARLNHVPRSERSQVLQEARRVLKDAGLLLITMINPVIGFVVHAVRRHYDLDQLERGMTEEEAKGLWDEEVRELLAENRLHPTEALPFVFGLNGLMLCKKAIQVTPRQ
jgi:ubiquinone/menaquinone biosynthesis C-methylase UbiE